MKILPVGCCQLCWLMHVDLICMLLSRSPSPKIILCICPKERHTLQDGQHKIPSPQSHSCNFLIIFSLVSWLQLANWSYEPHIWILQHWALADCHLHLHHQWAKLNCIGSLLHVNWAYLGMEARRLWVSIEIRT